MFLFVWACMWTSAFFPSIGLSALQTAATVVHARNYTPELTIPAAQSAPLMVTATRPLMTLGWVSEEDAPIF